MKNRNTSLAEWLGIIIFLAALIGFMYVSYRYEYGKFKTFWEASK